MIVALLLLPSPDATAPFQPLTNLDDATELAKVKFAASQATLTDQQRARRDVSRRIVEARNNEFMAGRGTIAFLFRAEQLSLDSELALLDTAADCRAALERSWIRRWFWEEIMRERHEAGRVPTKEYLETSYNRMGAEIAALPAWKAGQRAPTQISLAAATVFLEDAKFDGLGLLACTDLARAKFEAIHADARELAHARVELMRRVFWARQMNCLVGLCSPDFLREAALRLRDGQLLLSTKAIDRTAHFETYWMIARQNEDLEEQWFEAERAPLSEVMDASIARIDAERAFLEARKRSDTRITRAGPLASYCFLTWPYHAKSTQLDAGDLARAKFEMLARAPKELPRTRSKAARITYEYMLRVFLAGRGTLTFLLESAMHLLESELEESTTAGGRRAALERHQDRLAFIERVNLERYEAHRISVQEYLESIFWSLQAQIRLAREPKPLTPAPSPPPRRERPSAAGPSPGRNKSAWYDPGPSGEEWSRANRIHGSDPPPP
jgi:hypothetical protein